MWKRNGIDPVSAEQMLEEHDGYCACCGSDDHKGRGWCIDHCHTTGEVRGIVCILCNTMLGMARDDPKILQAGIDYLRSARQIQNGTARRILEEQFA